MSEIVKKLIFFLGLISFGVIATCLYYTESYFPLHPSIDTVLTPQFKQNFPKIMLGMSVTDVESLLGQPRSEASIYREDLHKTFLQSSGAVQSCWEYGSDGAAWIGDFAWLSYNVCFDNNDQVVETGVAIYYD